ncbi:flavin reductase [Plantactinospora sp. WMMB782]|uniref:flavin reductase n=1 Tax=Plantactinospora sp. WMMB782 TaxID=3404121 RepID=UPI003B959DF0
MVTRRPYAGFRPHTPVRPVFRCRECGGAWPCQPARLVLLAMYRDDRHRLAAFLAARLLAAIEDQPYGEPMELAERFLGWLPATSKTSDAKGGSSRMTSDQRNYRE